MGHNTLFLPRSSLQGQLQTAASIAPAVFRKVGKIFITHLHDDDTAGLATLLTSQWEFQSPPTDIYGSGVEAPVKGAI